MCTDQANGVRNHLLGNLAGIAPDAVGVEADETLTAFRTDSLVVLEVIDGCIEVIGDPDQAFGAARFAWCGLPRDCPFLFKELHEIQNLGHQLIR